MYPHSDQPEQQFVTLSGRITSESFINKCKQVGINPENVVYIFPGNDSHHGKEQNAPYTIKGGLNLAALAGELGRLNYPTLSLPTTFWDIKDKENQMVLAHKAVADLWRAIGYGMHLALPVREKGKVQLNAEKGEPILDEKGERALYSPNHFFTKSLDKTNCEPNFWGGIEKTPNTKLADYYLEQLNHLKTFLAQQAKAKEKEGTVIKFPHADFESAYIEGFEANQKVKEGKKPDDWFLPVFKRVIRATSKSATTPPIPTASLTPSLRGGSANSFVPNEPPLNLTQGETWKKIQEILNSNPHQSWQHEEIKANVFCITHDKEQFTIEKNKVSTATFTQNTFDKMAETLHAAGVKQTRIDAPDAIRAMMIEAAKKFNITIINAQQNPAVTRAKEDNHNQPPELRRRNSI